MSPHLPVLQVVVPLFCAPLCLVIGRERAARILAGSALAGGLAISLSLLGHVLRSGPISYALGGWAAPLGIEYRVDLLTAFVLCIVSGAALTVLPIGPGPRSHRIPAGREHLYHAAFLLCAAGLLGVVITGDIFNVFVFLEISSLASYTLVSLGRERRALRAAFSYLIMGTIGGTFVLIGIGLLYQQTATLNLRDLAARLPSVLDTRTVHAAFAFLSVGIGIKLAVFPLHQWLPGAYCHAPSAVSAFLAATSTKVAYYLLARIVFTVFGASFVFDTLGLDRILLPLSLLAMFGGAIAAIFQTNLKRMLAYSSVSQIGAMTLGLSFASVTGVAAGIVHLANHALIKGGLFLAVACMVARTGSSDLTDLRGIGRRMPLTAAAFALGGLGLIGVPATAGFVSKWYLVLAALESGHPEIGMGILLASLLAGIYVWRFVELAYFGEPPAEATADPGEAPWWMLAPTWIAIGASVVFGIFTDASVGIAIQSATELLGPQG